MEMTKEESSNDSFVFDDKRYKVCRKAVFPRSGEPSQTTRSYVGYEVYPYGAHMSIITTQKNVISQTLTSGYLSMLWRVVPGDFCKKDELWDLEVKPRAIEIEMQDRWNQKGCWCPFGETLYRTLYSMISLQGLDGDCTSDNILASFVEIQTWNRWDGVVATMLKGSQCLACVNVCWSFMNK